MLSGGIGGRVIWVNGETEEHFTPSTGLEDPRDVTVVSRGSTEPKETLRAVSKHSLCVLDHNDYSSKRVSGTSTSMVEKLTSLVVIRPFRAISLGEYAGLPY